MSILDEISSRGVFSVQPIESGLRLLRGMYEPKVYLGESRVPHAGVRVIPHIDLTKAQVEELVGKLLSFAEAMK